ncbi:MAG: DUF5050 domain-containing protein [Eubacteriales bacterium]
MIATKNKIIILVLIVVAMTICSCTENNMVKKNNGNSNTNDAVDQVEKDEHFETEDKNFNMNKNLQQGNLMSNIINKGLATVNKDYFIGALRNGIYKMKVPTSELELISNDLAYSINLYDGWVYYSNGYPGDGEIYKVNVNGGASKKLNDEISYNVIVCNDYIYYWTRKNLEKSVEYSIKRLSLDKNKEITIVSALVEKRETKFINDFYLYDNWIYYKNPMDSFKLYRISTNGEAEEKVSDEIFHNEYTNGKFIVNEDYIYFIQPNNNNNLYRINKGNGKIELALDKQIGTFNVDEEYIYFTDMLNNFSLCKVRKGEDTTIELSEHTIGEINLLDGLIYCQDFYKETLYYLFDLDGVELDLEKRHNG